MIVLVQYILKQYFLWQIFTAYPFAGNLPIDYYHLNWVVNNCCHEREREREEEERDCDNLIVLN